MSSLPNELIVEILRRLPPKDLLLCRCVSKFWRALIDGQDFIDSHLKYSIETSSNLSVLLKNSHVYSVSLDSLDDPFELDHPLMCYNHGITVLGSCNGLLCISNVVDDIALWNPSTRKHQVVPFLPLELKRYFGVCKCSLHVYGFGYDYINDDYKVVRIAEFECIDRKSFESEVKVFSLRTKLWKRIEDCPFPVRHPRTNGVCANGALHWVVGRSVESQVFDVIVAVDLALGQHREVLQPEYDGRGYGIEVGVLKGCLCFLANFQGVCVDLWVMEEHGVKDTWVKMFSITQYEVIGIMRSVKPLAYSKSGNEILMEHAGGHLFWYDIRRKTVNNVWISGLPITFEADVCVGSLVPVDMNRRVQRGSQSETEEGNGNKRDDFLSEGFKLVL